MRKWELLARSGWDVLVLLPAWWREAGRRIRARAGARGGLRVQVLPGIATGRLARWTPLGLGRRIAEFRADAVHAEEEPYSMSCWLAARAAAAAGAKFTFYTWENVRRRYSWPQERMIARVLAAAAGAVAGNREAAAILRRRGFRRPVAVVPQYGVDPAAFRPRSRAACRRALGWPSAGKVAGFVGRLEPEKGVETLLRAAVRIPGLRVAVVGGGPHAGRLREAAADLRGRVTFSPPVPRARIPLVMGALDVLVLPSRTTPRWKEQFGRVLVEAMAAGRWALGSSSGEIPAVLGDRGLVFREGDARGLERRLRRVLKAAPPARLRTRAIARFSERAVCAATAGMIGGILGVHAGGLTGSQG